jgi:hypothetical protein
MPSCVIIRAEMDHSRDRRWSPHTPPAANGSLRHDLRQAAPAADAGAGQECCDRCGSVRLIRVKACWRCEACGYKSDCNGW